MPQTRRDTATGLDFLTQRAPRKENEYSKLMKQEKPGVFASPPSPTLSSPHGRIPWPPLDNLRLLIATAILRAPGRAIVRVAAAAAAAVELDAVALARDAVAIAAALRAGRVAEAGEGAGAAVAGAAAREAGADGAGRAGRLQPVAVFGRDGGLFEVGGQVVDAGRVAVVGFADGAGCVRFGGFGVRQLRGRERAAFGDAVLAGGRAALAGVRGVA